MKEMYNYVHIVIEKKKEIFFQILNTCNFIEAPLQNQISKIHIIAVIEYEMYIHVDQGCHACMP